HFEQNQRKCLLHGLCPAKFHGQTVPELAGVRHRAEQVHIGLVLQLDIALDFSQELLFQVAQCLLLVQQVADEEQRKATKAKIGYPGRQTVAHGMPKTQGIHEAGQAARQHEDKNHRQHGNLQAAALQLLQFLFVEKVVLAHFTYGSCATSAIISRN